MRHIPFPVATGWYTLAADCEATEGDYSLGPICDFVRSGDVGLLSWNGGGVFPVDRETAANVGASAARGNSVRRRQPTWQCGLRPIWGDFDRYRYRIHRHGHPTRMTLHPRLSVQT